MAKKTKALKKVPTQTYVGIADAYGIESFKPLASDINLAILDIRANANRHRHAVVYAVDLSSNMVSEIEKHLSKGKYENALKCLKRCCTDDYQGQYNEPKAVIKSSSAHSLALIPNPTLDPYYN